MCHSAKIILPGYRASGIRPQQQGNRRNSISMGEVHRPSYTSSIGLPTYSHSLGQNSPGSMSSSSISSSSAPFLGRRASLPALGTDGLRIGSPRAMIRFLPTPLNDSMPELTSNESSEPFYPLSYPRFMFEKPITKTKLTLATVREQATELTRNQPVSKNDVETKEEEMIGIGDVKNGLFLIRFLLEYTIIVTNVLERIVPVWELVLQCKELTKTHILSPAYVWSQPSP